MINQFLEAGTWRNPSHIAQQHGRAKLEKSRFRWLLVPQAQRFNGSPPA
jgi:hypothetical protein